jgi:putative phosphonate metabolism protein
MVHRYAIYAVPDGPLGRFGAEWLGWDIAAGSAVPQPGVPGIDMAAATEQPRRYGFHATIKPPFRLAENRTAQELQAACAAFCANRAPVILTGLQLARMGRFLALVPSAPVPRLTSLAAEVVRDLDGFRAPLTEEELGRRRARHLTADQERNLLAWGYPFVMESFGFHLTLTGRLDRTGIDAIEAVLSGRLADHLRAPFSINHLSLVGEDPEGWFRELYRIPLTGPA